MRFPFLLVLGHLSAFAMQSASSWTLLIPVTVLSSFAHTSRVPKAEGTQFIASVSLPILPSIHSPPSRRKVLAVVLKIGVVRSGIEEAFPEIQDAVNGKHSVDL